MIDPETKQVLPLKLVAVKSADKIHFLRGSDFANDPTRTTALVILEPGFLLDVKMIETADGKWISIEEASTYGYKDAEVKKLKEIVNTVQGLSDLDDPTKIVENYQESHYLINQINKEKENLRN